MGYISKMVFITLTENEASRDNMMLVVKSIHDFEMSIKNIPKADYYDAVFNERLTTVKTIDRIWRKVMEHNPKLRGEEWEERHKFGKAFRVAIVQNQLSFFDNW